MKGIIIYENDLGAINAVKLRHASFCYESVGNNITDTLKGRPVACESANCSKEDTYDFETGALIALMKMCGREKVIKACDELYKDNNYKNALQETTDNNEKLIEENNYLKYIKSCNESTIKSLEDTNKTLKKEKEQIIVARNILYNNLREENEKLKLDCEKLQHGYNDINILFCGGRQNGKQHKALVELFKNVDQKKVDAAYKKAYNTTLPVWQKEILKQMYDICKESKERDYLASLIDSSKYATQYADEWFYKIPTKRQEMWAKILSALQDPPVDIKVAKQDITSFLKELQDHFPKAIWNDSKCLPTEYINPHWFEYDYIYFALFRYVGKGDLRICYDECKHAWIDKPVIDYLPPMRWDLFKKGRIAVRLTKDNYKDFYDICEKELGRSPSYKPEGYAYAPMEKFVLRYDKKLKGYIFLGSTESKKIVNWEDVR